MSETIPREATADVAREVPCWALVLLWSFDEPHRAGEVAFLPAFERCLVGRGDEEIDKFAHFGKHRPGEPLPTASREGFLSGSGISRRQLLLRATAVDIDMEQVGRATTFVNGEERTCAKLKEGDTILIQGEALLLCVRRPRVTPGPRARHPFGGPDTLDIVGEAPVTWQLREALTKSAATDKDVLIQGETGTGKELVANGIHNRSQRAKFPFVRRNASSFTVSLADSELYGNLANYPNPGMPARKGILGEADRGTLFLDEIGDCPPEVQARLLRVLEVGEYQALGEATTRRVDVRVIGATHKDDTAFRSDFRLRFRDSIRIPPLRERREDIPLLIRHCLLAQAREAPELAGRFCRVGATGGLEPSVSGRLVDYLVRQPLLGNMREIEGFVFRALKEALPEDDALRLPRSLFPSKTNTAPPSVVPAPKTEDRRPPLSKEELLEALASNPKNLSAVARSLGVSRKAIYRAMERYGIKKEDTDL
jgi:two-component system nitrogen regulation response regulator GlnG/two-component system response regulator HydG